jgi:hypothetical protein
MNEAQAQRTVVVHSECLQRMDASSYVENYDTFGDSKGITVLI